MFVWERKGIPESIHRWPQVIFSSSSHLQSTRTVLYAVVIPCELCTRVYFHSSFPDKTERRWVGAHRDPLGVCNRVGPFGRGSIFASWCYNLCCRDSSSSKTKWLRNVPGFYQEMGKVHYCLLISVGFFIKGLVSVCNTEGGIFF